MTKHLAIAVLVCLSAQAARVYATTTDDWFARANAFYEQQDYDSAAAYYERIVESGDEQSSDVCYNLGNTFFRLKKLGLAMLYYEKARAVAPSDPDIIANIKFAQLNIADRISEPERSFFDHVLRRLHTTFPLSTQLWILLGLLLMLSLLFSIGLFAARNMRLWLIYAGCLCVVTVGAFGISVGLKIHDAERTELAIVLEKSVDAVNEPNGSKVRFTVHEGTKFRVHRRRDEWCFVSLANGVSGWVRNSALGRI